MGVLLDAGAANPKLYGVVPPLRVCCCSLFLLLCAWVLSDLGDHFQTLKFDPCVGFKRNMSLCCFPIDFTWVLSAFEHLLCSVHGFLVKAFKTHAQDNEITEIQC